MGLEDRLRRVENQPAVTPTLGFLTSTTVVLLEGRKKIGQFMEILKINLFMSTNLIASALCFYCHNELAIGKTNTMSQSVTNTVKRVLVIVRVTIVLGKSLQPIKVCGCATSIDSVFLCSVINQFWHAYFFNNIEMLLL